MSLELQLKKYGRRVPFVGWTRTCCVSATHFSWQSRSGSARFLLLSNITRLERVGTKRVHVTFAGPTPRTMRLQASNEHDADRLFASLTPAPPEVVSYDEAQVVSAAHDAVQNALQSPFPVKAGLEVLNELYQHADRYASVQAVLLRAAEDILNKAQVLHALCAVQQWCITHDRVQPLGRELADLAHSTEQKVDATWKTKLQECLSKTYCSQTPVDAAGDMFAVMQNVREALDCPLRDERFALILVSRVCDLRRFAIEAATKIASNFRFHAQHTQIAERLSTLLHQFMSSCDAMGVPMTEQEVEELCQAVHQLSFAA